MGAERTRHEVGTTLAFPPCAVAIAPAGSRGMALLAGARLVVPAGHAALAHSQEGARRRKVCRRAVIFNEIVQLLESCDLAWILYKAP